jgi:hypothetical protein
MWIVGDWWWWWVEGSITLIHPERDRREETFFISLPLLTFSSLPISEG